MQTLVEIGSLSCAKSDTTHILFPDKIGKNSHIFKTQPHLFVINDIINTAILILFFIVSLFTNELMKSKSSTERKKNEVFVKKKHIMGNREVCRKKLMRQNRRQKNYSD